MSELLSTFKEVKANIASLRKAAVDIAHATFKEGTDALFEAHPTLHSISWTQYTPYFNDGDPCEFSSNANYATLNNEEGEFEDADGYAVNYAPPSAEARAAVEEFLGVFDDDDYLQLFGDHQLITITRENGIVAAVCDHD